MLKFIEGFEQFGESNGAANLAPRYTLSSSGFTEVQDGRFGGKCLRITGNRLITTPPLGNSDTWVVGFAFLRPTSAATTPIVVAVMEDGGAVEGINIRSNNDDGSLSIRRGNTVLGTTGVVYDPDVWTYIELKVNIDDTTGSFELRVNGSTVASGSGTDTQAGSSGLADRIRFGGNSSTQIDDVWVSTDDFLGDRKVMTIFPSAGGDSDDWTPDEGNNFARLNETPSDGDSSYVESDTEGDLDLYQFDNVSGFGSIDGIQVSAVARKTDTGNFDLALPVKSGTTQSDGDSAVVDHSDYQTVSRIVEVDPDTESPWTVGGVNSAQFGVKNDT